MEGVLQDTWGKLHIDDNGVILSWHPLQAHCADVAAVAEALLQRTNLGRRIGKLMGHENLTDGHVARLCFLAALHDAGKVNHGFQRRASRPDAPRVGHVRTLLDFLRWDEGEKRDIIDALGLGDLLTWFSCEEELVAFLYATFAHHGTPVSASPGFRPELWRSESGRAPIEQMRELRYAAFRWFPGAFQSDVTPFPPATELPHAFNGLLTLADWIASDEDFFPYAPDSSDRMPFARRRARAVLLALGLDVEATRYSLGPSRPHFGMVSPFSPRPVQGACSDLVDHPHGSLTILESDTGSGKTEAALVRFVQLLHAGLVDGMYFALPTRSAATQLHDRVRMATERAFPNAETRPPVVLAVPGYLTVDDVSGQRLAPFEVLWDDRDQDRWRYRGWAGESSKRYLASPIAIGTIDQVLLSTLQVKHAHLRAAALSRLFLVVDEVHASDTYMAALLEEVVKHHLKAGGHVFLMSATLGSVAQARLLRAAPLALAEAERLAYPLVTHSDGRRQQMERVPRPSVGEPKTIEMAPMSIADHPVEIARQALHAAARGARVLVIRNTVRDCLATQVALEDLARGQDARLFHAAGVVAPHHSRFAAPDRKILDAAIEEKFGKESPRDGVVVVATQTVEQSLDIDADLMLTDLCPADVLLQRLGRLHRHRVSDASPGVTGRTRPQGFESPRGIVLLPDDRSLGALIRGNGRGWGPHGLGTVYEDLRVLEATWRLLERDIAWRIPEMNRSLVEAATHPDALREIVDSLGDPWPSHERHVLGVRSADRTQAGLCLLPRDKPFGDVLFPSDLDERIKTRLGEGDRRIELGEELMSPFGQRICELTLPAYQAPDADEGAVAENIAASDGTVTFGFCGKRFIYNRLGLHPAEEERNEE